MIRADPVLDADLVDWWRRLIPRILFSVRPEASLGSKSILWSSCLFLHEPTEDSSTGYFSGIDGEHLMTGITG
jgi:hypothetical protein